MIIERLLDLLVLLFALAAAMMFFEVVSLTDGPLLGGSAVALMAGTLLMGVLLAFPETFEPFVRMGLARIERHSPVLGAKLIEAFSRLIQTLRVLTRGWRAISLLFWTIAAWFFEGAVFYAIARAIPDLTNPAAAWFAMPVGTLSTLLPSTPGYVGTFHYFVSRSAELLGNTAAAAAAFSVATHLLLWASATLWGAVSFAAWLAMRSERHPNIGTSP